MEETNKIYRIRTGVGDDAPKVIHVPINQTYDMFEILSLKLDQKNVYKTYESDYGIVVGRVIANGGVGVENAKVSIFIPSSEDDDVNKFLYAFTSVNDTDQEGIKYNLLPKEVDDVCHQSVGTFPNKTLILDSKNRLEIFDKYWRFTTTTNKSGDYMIFGVPTGSQSLHCDIDLSDCGILSQRPYDMIGKGYNAEMFDSPNKFKKSTNLNSLPQIISQDKSIYVYPYWGDVSSGDETFAITRCDINLDYKFESYAVFMGSIITDKGSNAIGKNCTGTEQNGNMEQLTSGSGRIEMIRKTLNGKIEEFQINGNSLIDSDGVWCYPIPMNLDYVTTDEFGSLIPTNNPNKGIATRARVRFRIGLSNDSADTSARKRARYLVPNNPRMGDTEFEENDMKVDYEFGTNTRDESFCDLFWNKVYTVKNYIPKLQKNNKVTNRKHTGIKMINNHGDNNPMPYNSLTIKLGFTYKFLCVLIDIFINLVGVLNNIISALGGIFCTILTKWPLKYLNLHKYLPKCVALSGDLCPDSVNPSITYPGCGKPMSCIWKKVTRPACQKEQSKKPRGEQKMCSNSSTEFKNCVENELAKKNDAVSFNFYNDWVNGVLYAPLWYRRFRKKKKYFFGLFSKKAKDEWCSAEYYNQETRIIQSCVIKRHQAAANQRYENFDKKEVTPYYMTEAKTCGNDCHKAVAGVMGLYGLIKAKQTILEETVYYYNPIDYDKNLSKNTLTGSVKDGEIKLLFATDIVLLGSLNDCDMHGVPQFFKALENTTYNMPTDLLFTDFEIENKLDTNGKFIESEYSVHSEAAGNDWGNKNEYGKRDGGLFYSIGCSDIKLMDKSCINLSRICEFGVSLDVTKEIARLKDLDSQGDNAFEKLITDGFISYDEITNFDERSMFATMNSNKLKTKLNTTNGLLEYDFRYLYIDNFDGSLKNFMKAITKSYDSKISYRNNYRLENFSRDYYIFRMGNTPYYYDSNHTFPRYENSFYFYFGLKSGRTALDKFNEKYMGECVTSEETVNTFGLTIQPNDWCSQYGTNVYVHRSDGKVISEMEYNALSEEQKSEYFAQYEDNNGYIAFKIDDGTAPYSLLINSTSNTDFSLSISDIEFDKFYFCKKDVSALDNKGYKRLCMTDDDQTTTNCVQMLNNGDYVVQITDIDDRVFENSFTIEGTYLTFKTSVQEFNQTMTQLLETYGTYSEIANNMDGIQYVEDSKRWVRNNGGVITVYDIAKNTDELQNYVIRVSPGRETYDRNYNIEGYEGVVITKNGETINIEPKQLENSVHHYNNTFCIGVPKGGIVYNVKVTELCSHNGVYIESGNSVTYQTFVANALDYRLLINGVDYELIKNFNRMDTNYYSCGLTAEKTIAKRDSYLQDTLGTVKYENNPWFNMEKIWSKDKFVLYKNIADNVNEIITKTQYDAKSDIEKSKYERIVLQIPLLDENDEQFSEHGPYHDYQDFLDAITNRSFVIYRDITIGDVLEEFTQPKLNNVFYNWCNDYIAEEYNTNSFKPLVQKGFYVEYNEDNWTDFLEDINVFLEKVNEIILLRENLPSLMYNAFYMTGEEVEKYIEITTQTAKLPVTTTLVYQVEEAIEEENEYNQQSNTLTTNNMVISYDDFVSDIRIPTITYASSEYGIANYVSYGISEYQPVVSRIGVGKNARYKHAYYVGVMNSMKESIPSGLNAVTYTDVSNAFKINENTPLRNLFDFPIIDKRIKINTVSWACVEGIPYYKKLNSNRENIIDEVTMHGFCASNVLNGVWTNNNKLATQELHGNELVMSNNLITSGSPTYVDKRVLINNNFEWVFQKFVTNTVNESFVEEDITNFNWQQNNGYVDENGEFVSDERFKYTEEILFDKSNNDVYYMLVITTEVVDKNVPLVVFFNEIDKPIKEYKASEVSNWFKTYKIDIPPYTDHFRFNCVVDKISKFKAQMCGYSKGIIDKLNSKGIKHDGDLEIVASNIDNCLNGVYVSGGYYCYDEKISENKTTGFRLNIEKVLQEFLGFKNYIVDNNAKYLGKYWNVQYSPLLSKTNLELLDSNSNGISHELYGRMQVVMSSESTSYCGMYKISSNEPELAIVPFIKLSTINGPGEGNVTYSIIPTNGDKTYPLNYVEEREYGVSQIIGYVNKNDTTETDIIYKYEYDKPETDKANYNPITINKQYDDRDRHDSYNIFSINTLTSDLQSKTNEKLIHNGGRGWLSYDPYNNNEVKSRGYGTTGYFSLENRGRNGIGGDAVPVYAFYVVAETNDGSHCRAISPVYELTYIYFDVAVGKGYGSKLNVSVNPQTNRKEFTIEGYEMYRFGCAMPSKTPQYYIKNGYPFTLSVQMKYDPNTEIQILEETNVNTIGFFVSNEIKGVSDTIKAFNVFDKINKAIQQYTMPGSTYNIADVLDLYVEDYVGLRHKGIGGDWNDSYHDCTWYSYLWYVNAPSSSSSYIGIISDGSIFTEKEDFYLANTERKNITIYKEVQDNNQYEWVGWSEDRELEDGEKPISDWNSVIDNNVTRKKVFIGNWKLKNV